MDDPLPPRFHTATRCADLPLVPPAGGGETGTRKRSPAAHRQWGTTMRAVVDRCTDCDVCRYLMEDACLMFPELYRLWDRERAGGGAITEPELRDLAQLCCFCALCPCPEIRTAIVQAKSEWAERQGLPLGVRLIANPGRLSRICGTLPHLANRVLASPWLGKHLKRRLGIHPQRRMPVFAARGFDAWVRRHGLDRKPAGHSSRRVLYFVGCSGRYLFPDVLRAAVGVMQAGGVTPWIPEQGCCGMPMLLEGDRPQLLVHAEKNLALLAGAVAEGYQIVCSCPTCSYMLRMVLSAGIPPGAQESSATGLRVMARGLLAGEDCFTGLPPAKRLQVSRHTHDLGVFLLALQRDGALPLVRHPPVAGRMAYFAPCHQREQEIGRPYEELLRPLLGQRLDTVDGSFACCGMGGIMGLKHGYHQASLGLGRRLFDQLAAKAPDAILTDCLSCRLQFQHALPCHPVFHPIEILCRFLNRGSLPASPD
jgi:glycerol-3-phosphate dehydrogenase subunit C